MLIKLHLGAVELPMEDQTQSLIFTFASTDNCKYLLVLSPLRIHISVGSQQIKPLSASSWYEDWHA